MNRAPWLDREARLALKVEQYREMLDDRWVGVVDVVNKAIKGERTMLEDWVEVKREVGEAPLAAPVKVWLEALLAELPREQRAAIMRRVEQARKGRAFGGAAY